MPGYGRRGGEGPTRGRRAIRYTATDPATGERYEARRFYEVPDPVICVWPRHGANAGKKPYVTCMSRCYAPPYEGTNQHGDKVLAAVKVES